MVTRTPCGGRVLAREPRLVAVQPAEAAPGVGEADARLLRAARGWKPGPVVRHDQRERAIRASTRVTSIVTASSL